VGGGGCEQHGSLEELKQGAPVYGIKRGPGACNCHGDS
jgi:hypothetical protein